MTVVDLVDNFRLIYDLAASGLPGFEDDEIKALLQKNQFKAINQKFGGNNVYGSEFPNTQKRIDDLRRLIISVTVASEEISYRNAVYSMQIPSSYLHLISVSMITYGEAYTDINTNEATRIDYSQIQRFQRSKNNVGVYIKNPVYFFNNNGLIQVYVDEVYKAENPNLDFSLTYIKNPQFDLTTVANTTELEDFDDGVYYEIVEMTKDEAVAITMPSKSQISQQQLNKME